MSMSFDGVSFISESGCKFRNYSSSKLKVGILDFGPSRTKQYFKDECDVNVLMARYMQTGIMPGDDPSTARYFDCVPFQELSYQGMFDLVANAHEQFFQLPSKVRERFMNDPGRLIAFMDDPANAQEAISLGLVPDPMQKEPKEAPGATASVLAEDQAKK